MNTPNLPTHERIYRRLRDMVLYGDLAPGQAVTLHGLVAELGVSTTPVREAIRRLTAAGALELRGNRRVAVPVPDTAALAELHLARRALEPELARRGAHQVDAQLIDRLCHIDDQLDAAMRTGDVRGYMRQNHAFHFTLYGAARAQVLEPLAEALWLRFGPLGRVICGRFGTARMPDRHDETIAALRARDAEAAAAAIAADIDQGFALMQAGVDDDRII